jgi:enamine deaminase RidA (YjgF/YER057c/UK114 family)
MRRHVSSGTPWEDEVGYSRAVRVGDTIRVSGTTATDEDGAIVAPGQPYEQTVQAIGNVERALAELDAGLDDVVRTRLFVTDIDDWEAIGRAHGDAFQDVKPATTMVEVSRLIDGDLVVEIEAEAVVE